MHARRALIVLAVAYVVAFASGGIQLPLTSTAMEHVGLSMSAIGVMWAARQVLGIFGPALWGVLADRRGDTKPYAVASLASGAVLLALLSVTTSAAPAIALFGFYGLLCGPSGSLLDGMTIQALGDDKARFGRWRMWGTIGFGLSALGSALLLDRGLIAPSPRVIFPVCALFTAAGAVSVGFVPRLPRPPLGRVRDVLPLLRRPDMSALFVTCTLLWCSHAAYSGFLTPLAAAQSLPEWSVGASLAVAIVVEVVMLREAGFFIARFGGRTVILASCALAVLRWALTALATSPAAFIALNALHGITFGLFFATLVAMVAARAPPQMRQAAQGVVGSSAFGLGGGVGSLLVGAVFQHVGAPAAWASMAVMAALAFVVALRIPRV